MDEQETKFLCKLNVMLLDIEQAYEAEKDPLTRCELAKGYLEIGKYLKSMGFITPTNFSKSS
ncbi:TPA: hypothetical protein TXT63_001076 [Streptococcus suis]|uniref:Uncharacterized protein n=1 Tax=Streptococcus suis TaxID=1307 RepID=A0AB33UA79_STRSU|nr:hypothetical protein [Streptococcus suis]QBX21631.1 hypothetical protein Javan585_0005 [Streptococcus phage Javan585]ASW52625.1 hypothetical protein A7J09_11195 [Streptococcus suis]KPA70649.1 hypothetical protein XK26_00605 [Streptococcus suis]MBS8079052.1 hypothetical protein [Streptococcus suis]MCK3965365.1 hypothetical protein [Streptococcus suis]